MVERASIALREFRRDLTPTATLCLLTLSLILLAAILAPFLAPYREGEILTTGSFVSPGEGLLLGSDYLGRDLFSRLFYGLRLTVAVSFMIAILAFLVGCSLGFLAAVLGGRFDMLISRLVDALIAFPAIMLALIVLTALGPSIPVLSSQSPSSIRPGSSGLPGHSASTSWSRTTSRPRPCVASGLAG